MNKSTRQKQQPSKLYGRTWGIIQFISILGTMYRKSSILSFQVNSTSLFKHTRIQHCFSQNWLKTKWNVNVRLTWPYRFSEVNERRRCSLLFIVKSIVSQGQADDDRQRPSRKFLYDSQSIRTLGLNMALVLMNLATNIPSYFVERITNCTASHPTMWCYFFLIFM